MGVPEVSDGWPEQDVDVVLPGQPLFDEIMTESRLALLAETWTESSVGTWRNTAGSASSSGESALGAESGWVASGASGPDIAAGAPPASAAREPT